MPARHGRRRKKKAAKRKGPSFFRAVIISGYTFFLQSPGLQALVGIHLTHSQTRREGTPLEERRTDRLTLKIQPSLKSAAAKKAKEQGRTLSNYVEMLILTDLYKKAD